MFIGGIFIGVKDWEKIGCDKKLRSLGSFWSRVIISKISLANEVSILIILGNLSPFCLKDFLYTVELLYFI